jgi:ribosomal protein S18 acetylase RimI-like enzyme
MVTAAAIHGIDLSLIWGTIDRSTDGRPLRVRQACLVVPGSGRTAMLVLSGPGSGSEAQEHAERVAAIEAACGFLGDRQRSGRDIRLAQSLPEPTESWAVRALTAAAFRHVGDLAYLRRPMTSLPTVRSQQWPAGITVRQVRDVRGDDRRFLIEALDRSYLETLDCPDLCGLRETADVLESHRATGVFDARLWWLVMMGGEAHGCMLFNNCPEHESVELVYLGLSPQLRGKRLGGALLSMGLAALAGVGASSITCAVDLRNSPAQRLYARSGFREFGRRIAMVRPVGSA